MCPAAALFLLAKEQVFPKSPNIGTKNVSVSFLSLAREQTITISLGK
jgi:hypothetical protein